MNQLDNNIFDLDGGITEGDTCGRLGCDGLIEEDYRDSSCSCHINPPCGHCVEMTYHCNKCHWTTEGEEDYLKLINPEKEKAIEVSQTRMINDFMIEFQKRKEDFENRYKDRSYIPEKIEYIHDGTGYAHMVKRGMFPPNTSSADVEAQVKGTFGGKFTMWKDNRFIYKAYTD